MSDLARQLIAEAKAKKLQRLDLGNCGLTSDTIPEELFELSDLRELILSNLYHNFGDTYNEIESPNHGNPNHFTCLPDTITQLTELQRLIIAGDSVKRWNINNLKVIGSLSKLVMLNCSYNEVSKLNLSDLPALRELDCSENQLTKLELLELPALIKLNCSSNQLSKLNLSDLPALHELDCSENQLTKLNLSDLPALHELDCSENQLTKLSLSGLPALTMLYCNENQLPKLSLSQLPSLAKLDCSSNELIKLNLSELPVIYELDCSGNQLTILSLSELPALAALYCAENQITTLSISELPVSLRNLDCSYNELTRLNLSDLPALHELDCSYNLLTELNLSALSALCELNCSYNELTKLELSNLPALQVLYCSSNLLTKLNLLDLPALTKLDCNYNQLSKLSLSKLPAFCDLDCSYNQLTRLSLLELPACRVLNCNSNQLAKLGLSELPSLHTIYCSGNRLAKLNLSELSALRIIYCNGNQLTEIGLSDLPALHELHCSNNQLIELSLSDLPALLELDCSENQLTEIGLSDLPALHKLNCSNNQLRVFPRSLLALPSLKKLDVRENPLPIPSNLTKDTYLIRQKLIDYYAEIDKGSSAIQRLKTILVGNGCVGKSTLLYQLKEGIYKPFPLEDRTHGVVIEEWQATDNLMLNLWDFAGQEVYHPTHRLFLSQRALYLLVWATDTPCHQGENNPLAYWLDYIADLGQGSWVQIVRNQFEGQTPKDSPELSETELDFYRQLGITIDNRGWIDAKNGTRISPLRSSIIEDAQQLVQCYPQPEPMTWELVRQQLEQERQTQKTISLSHFQSICHDAKVNSHGDTTLLHHLHDTGQIYYYSDLFGNEIILQQDWALEAVYAILKADSLKRYKGRLRRDDLYQIWHERYSKDEQDLFIGFMLNCEIIFQKGNYWDREETEYIVPQLLAETIPSHIRVLWKGHQHKLLLRLTYPFLHRSMLDRFLIRALTLCKNTDTVYRNGILFGEADGNTAYVEFGPLALSEQRAIFIACWGSDPATLLGRIRNEFDQIRSLERSTQQISIDGKTWETKGPAQRWEELLVSKTEYKDFIHAFSIDETLLKSAADKMKKKVFISYSKHDKAAYLDRLLNQLKALQNFDILIYWEDNQLKPGELWEERIQAELETADVIIVLASEHSFATDYIWNKEIPIAVRRADNKEAILFPIVLDHCLWEQSPLTKYVILPTKAKPIKDHKDQGKVWKEVAMALAKLIKDLDNPV